MAEFNPQQLEIIEGFGQGQAVIAGAGCGKTTTLVAKCIRLLELQPEARFCAVSFTEKSVRDLKQSLAEGFQIAQQDGRVAGFDQHQHWVKTIHGLCYSILQEFPEAAGLAGGERILLEDEAERLWRRSTDQLWSQNDNVEISEALGRLMRVYNKLAVETLLSKLRQLESFGVESWIRRQRSTPLQDLWRVFDSVRSRYTRSKQRGGAVDFNDLEVFASRALDSERVRRFYHQRFQLVLVDEFQDTNPVQGQILEKFVRPGFQNLCIVGDPKQSIYRFRDADVTVFQELTKRLARKHLLTTNYRSRPPIIDFVNEVCDPLFSVSDMEYEPLLAGKPEVEPGLKRLFKLEVQAERDLARFLRQEQERGVDLSEFVLLARSVKKERTQAYLSAFEAEGVPFVFGSGGRFFSDPRVVELVAFLKGWISRNNSLAQATALRSPWIGATDAELLQWKSTEQGFFDCFFAAGTHPIAQALGSWYQSRAAIRPGEILERLWGLDSMAEEMLLPIATLWQKCEDLSAQGSRYHEIVSQLDRWIESEKIESDIPPPNQEGAVRVMTVHASKGLQFPRVILIDFEKAARPDNRKDLLWSRQHGVYLFERDEDGERLKSHPENERWSELEARANVAESKRVFYVALTRAQEALYFVWPLKEKEDYKERELDLARDYWRAWAEHLGASHLERVDCAAIPPRVQPVTEARRRWVDRPRLQVEPDAYRPRHSPSEWLILHQCPLRYHFEYAVSIEPEQSAEGAIPRAEQLDFTDFERGTDVISARQTQSAVAKKGEKVHLLIEEERWDELAQEFRTPEIGSTIVQKLRAALSEESGREFKEVGFEVPFSRDEALVGVMDRLVLAEEPGDTIFVTDYKWTGSPRPPAALLDHYLLQLQLYAWAARRMISEPGGNHRPVKARLLHFTQDSMELVRAPETAFDPVRLDATVQECFRLSKELLFNHSIKPVDWARPGAHCRYCSHQKRCPKVDGLAIS